MAEQKKKKLPDLPAFAAEIRSLLKNPASLPPVESWQPERSGEIDILINANGEWFYQGEPMARQSVVQLLSSILRKEGVDYYLVSPAEKLRINVEDVPFVVQMMDVEGVGEQQLLHFSTQVGDCFTLNDQHRLRVAYNDRDEPAPYIHVRGGMEAKLSRTVYYELVDYLQEWNSAIPCEQVVRYREPQEDRSQLGVWSAGKFFIF